MRTNKFYIPQEAFDESCCPTLQLKEMVKVEDPWATFLPLITKMESNVLSPWYCYVGLLV